MFMAIVETTAALHSVRFQLHYFHATLDDDHKG